MCTVPKHEQLKQDLVNQFEKNKSYVGSHIKDVIHKADFRSLVETEFKPTKIKKGDTLRLQIGVKKRPVVVTNVAKDGTCTYIPLTSTDNVHCLTEYSSRFWGEGCFSKTFSVCTEEVAIENFIGVFDNIKDLNRAIKALKEYITKNL